MSSLLINLCWLLVGLSIFIIPCSIKSIRKKFPEFSFSRAGCYILLIGLYVAVILTLTNQLAVERFFDRASCKSSKYTIDHDSEIVHLSDCSLVFKTHHIVGTDSVDPESLFKRSYTPCKQCSPYEPFCYLVNKTNGMIHESTCSYLPYSGNCEYFDTFEEAKEAGFYLTCSHCDPADSFNNYVSDLLEDSEKNKKKSAPKSLFKKIIGFLFVFGIISVLGSFFGMLIFMLLLKYIEYLSDGKFSGKPISKIIFQGVPITIAIIVALILASLYIS